MPKTPEETVATYDSMVNKTVRFTSNIDDFEDYPEVGMLAIVRDIRRLPDEGIRITLDYGAHADHNVKLETASYFDKTSKAVLTAREAGFYHDVDTLYVDEDYGFPFEVVQPDTGEAQTTFDL